MIIAGSGHRPEKLGGYSENVFIRLVTLAKGCLMFKQPDLVITGMALGWDQALAAACQQLNIPYHAYIPFKGQEGLWPTEAQRKYKKLLKGAEKVVTVSAGGYSAYKMHKRNEAMVDACDELLVLFNGDPRSGTSKCIDYAKLKDKTVTNLWKEWEKMNGEKI
jgi:uncharacterized phage-like protein YoqJ